MIAINHFTNFNVMNLERSLPFYQEALGLHVVREEKPQSGSFRLVFLGDDRTRFNLELTWLMDRGGVPFNPGACEYNLTCTTDEYDALHQKHGEMGCIALENPAAHSYFIKDPDGYWIEIREER